MNKMKDSKKEKVLSREKLATSASWWKGKNLRYKALAILLAIVLWFYAANERGVIRDRVFEDIPLAVQGLSSDLILVGDLPRIQITLRGNVDSLNIRELMAYLDLSGITAGEVILPVQVNVPGGITLVGVKPSRVKVLVDTRAEKQIPVEVRLSGQTAEGYVAMTPDLKPSQVLISGAKSLLARVQQANVSIDLRNTDRSLNEMIPVKVLDREGKLLEGLQITPASIELFVPVIRGQSLKSVAVKVLWSGSPAPGFQVVETKVEPAMVNLISLPVPLDQIEQISTLPIDISGATENVVRSVPLETIPGISGVEPAQVTVTIQITKKSGEKELGPITVQAKDTPSHLTAVVQPAEVSISLEGPWDLIEKVTAKDFLASVPLTGLSEGKHQVRVQVTGPAGVDVIRVNPESLTVTLTALEEKP
ncbi:MAG: hypothetical protein GX295_06405 [Syntrophomonadaceae bacterium]|nr:hypothetical protein [Syntrophomonadaceae bacterium]